MSIEHWGPFDLLSPSDLLKLGLKITSLYVCLRIKLNDVKDYDSLMFALERVGWMWADNSKPTNFTPNGAGKSIKFILLNTNGYMYHDSTPFGEEDHIKEVLFIPSGNKSVSNKNVSTLGLSSCPLCGSSGIDLCFSFRCDNALCVNSR